MSFLRTPDEGDDAGLYAADRAALGYVPNYTRVFALNPGVYAAWQGLNAAVKQDMDLRRYELATFAAARALRSSYCALAHGSLIRDRFHDAATVAAMATDHHQAGLSEADVAIMDLAARVATDGPSVTAEDLDAVRRHGLSEAEIFQVVLAAAARCFFSTVLDATGTEPDARYRDTVDESLRTALTVGRPVAETG
ncbi:MAG TPA: hypothetical protein VGD67_08675 [Pseudonocardiaceae bacterium]